MAIRRTTWKVKSQDSKVKVEVQLSRRHKEIGKARYTFASGEVQEVSYKPRKFKAPKVKLSEMAILCGGFLSGILLEGLTNFLKLR